MNNKQFREAIYNKYEYYQKNNNDEFFNTYHYRKNSKNILLNKVAVFFIFTLLMGSVVYAGTVIYQYFTQKTSQAYYIEDMDSWFEINNQETHYKKISSYEEYLKYKEKWSSIIDMTKEDFEDNFLIVVIASWRMPGISIANISSDDNTLYVELESKVTEEEIKKEEYMVSAKVLQELDRENISVKEIVKEIKSDKYEKIENLPSDYNIESAKQDGCTIVNDNKISSEDEERLEDFIEKTKNGIEDYIRIFRRNELKENGEEIIITDIEYREGEYILYMDETRSVLPGDKSIIYLGTFQNIEIREDKRNTGLYLRKLTGTEVCVALY